MFTTPGDIGELAEKLQQESTDVAKCFSGLEPVVVGDEGVGVSNRVLYFHGYGDTQQGMAAAARSLRLPQTVSYAFRGLEPLPLGLEGRGWYPCSKILAGLYPDAVNRERLGRQAAVATIVKLMQTCTSLSSETYLSGHGQGAELCLWIASEIKVRGIVLLSLPTDATLPTKVIKCPVCLHSSDPPPPSLKNICSALTITKGTQSLLPVAEWYSKHIALRLLSLDNDPSVIKVQPDTVHQMS
eukprot:TRINITY_DN26300_c0_g1_i1.p1 TRINITY_DN26300_c0_g1~~TRINITY_DN26300_c0_g1_i1.p1  ORF type:complete len:242 (+),score=39.76 TRINITY_DN26300_c0_g1_i1:74-799(+)